MSSVQLHDLFILILNICVYFKDLLAEKYKVDVLINYHVLCLNLKVDFGSRKILIIAVLNNNLPIITILLHLMIQ